MSAERDPLVGRLVAGKYLVTRRIARGGMGRIYKAEQQPLGRPVALKVLDASYAQDGIDPAFEQRFLLEAATCARLRHPNTVTVFDYGRTDIGGDSTLFMVQEFVDGVTLRRLLRTEGPLDPRTALTFGREIARSLREAHRMGVVHRDLKPTNIMVVHTEEGDALKVLDFGIVKLMSDDASPAADITVGGRYLGTPRYMAPEQAARKAIDHRTDIYSLGVVLYELMTGSPPFSGDPMQVLIAHVKSSVPPLAENAPNPIPPAIESIVMRCLRKVPDNRFEDTSALIAAIDAALGNTTSAVGAATLTGAMEPGDITVPPPTGVGRSSKAGLIAGILMALLVVAIGIFFIPGGDGPTEPTEAPRTAQPQTPEGAPSTAPGAATAANTPTEPPPSPAAPAEPVVDAAPPAPPPSVALTTNPPGAQVRLAGELLGTTPIDVPLEGDLPLSVDISLAGYEGRAVELGEGGPLHVKLARRAPKPAPRPKPKPKPKPTLDIRTSR